MKAVDVDALWPEADDPADMKVIPLPSSSIEPVTDGDAGTPGNAFESHP